MPKIVAMTPLKTLSERDGLPDLGRLPISAYQRVGSSRKDLDALGRFLHTHTLRS